MYESNQKKKAPVLTPKELKRLLFVVRHTRNPERNALIVWLLFGAALRLTEVVLLEVKDVLNKNGTVKKKVVIPAKHTKNGKAGHVFFYHRKLIKALEDYLNLRADKKILMVDSDEYRGFRKDSKLILSENRRAYSLKENRYTKTDGTVSISYVCDTLQASVSKWGREAGIEGFTTHSGRRTFATRLARKGADEDTICLLMRHQTNDQPYEYIDADLEGIKKTINAIFPEMDDDEIEELA